MAMHGGRFHYVSPNTDLLGWVIERAAGRRYADLMSELRLAAGRRRAQRLHHRRPPRRAALRRRHVRHRARPGARRAGAGGRHGWPKAWIDDIESNGDPAAWQAGAFVELFRGAPIHYRSKWYVLRGATPALFGFGVHGQFLLRRPPQPGGGRQILLAGAAARRAAHPATLQLADTIRNRLAAG